MGGEGEEEGSEMATKLALVLAAKSNAYTTPGSPNLMASPLHTLASVPFCWEEEPGKPKHHLLPSHLPPHSCNKCLELPPRLLLSSGCPREFTKLPLPAPGVLVATGRRGGREGKSWALMGLWKGKGKRDVGKGSYVFPSCGERGREIREDDGGGGISSSKQITRLERPGNLYSLSTPRSHFWANVYKRFKQISPWRCKKLRRDGL